MKIAMQDILKKAKFDNPDIDYLKHENPRQFISEGICIPVWKVKYSYVTKRGNQKESTKYLFAEESAYDLIDILFNNYIEKFNEKYPYKSISNVQILDCRFIGSMLLDIENY